TLLIKQLGWFGRLALAPPDTTDVATRDTVLAPARETFVAVMLLLVVLAFMGLGGLIGLFVLVVLLASGTVAPALGKWLPYGGVYAETFAIWMILYVAIGLGIGGLAWLKSRLGVVLPGPDLTYLLLGAADLCSLVVLAWPVFRGIPWKQVRDDIGLTVKRKPVREAAAGVATYAMALPLLVAGVLVVS